MTVSSLNQPYLHPYIRYNSEQNLVFPHGGQRLALPKSASSLQKLEAFFGNEFREKVSNSKRVNVEAAAAVAAEVEEEQAAEMGLSSNSTIHLASKTLRKSTSTLYLSSSAFQETVVNNSKVLEKFFGADTVPIAKGKGSVPKLSSLLGIVPFKYQERVMEDSRSQILA